MSEQAETRKSTTPAEQSTGEETATSERPLRIIIGADTFTPDVNGAARFAERLAIGLSARGHDVHIVAPAAGRRHGTWTEVYEGQSVTAHRLKSYRWYPHDWLRFAWPFTIERVADRLVEEIKPDVVHFQSHIVTGRGLSIAAKKRGIRLVGTNHFMPENLMEHTVIIPKRLENWAKGLAWNAAKRSFERADAVTTPTVRAKEYLEAATGLEGVRAISCGIRKTNYTADFSDKPVKTVIFVGRVTGEKHIDVLIRAFAKLPRSINARLQIVGGGDQLEQLKKLAREQGIGDLTTFTGYVDDDDLRRDYTDATVLCMPSIAELQSIVTMEAMASGLPVVAADAMALPHLVHDGENGYLFKPGDVDDCREKLERVLTMPNGERNRMQEESLRIVEAHDIDKTIDTFEKLYRGIDPDA